MKQHTFIIAFWSPFPIASADYCMDFFASFFCRQNNIQCLNCINEQDERNRQLLRRADLLVVVLRQNHFAFSKWLIHDLYRISNCLYLITDYIPGNGTDFAQIESEFRIPPSRIGCIPYNTEYHAAVLNGDPQKYLFSPRRHHSCQNGMDFYRELRRSAYLILKAVDDAV